MTDRAVLFRPRWVHTLGSKSSHYTETPSNFAPLLLQTTRKRHNCARIFRKLKTTGIMTGRWTSTFKHDTKYGRIHTPNLPPTSRTVDKSHPIGVSFVASVDVRRRSTVAALHLPYVALEFGLFLVVNHNSLQHDVVSHEFLD